MCITFCHRCLVVYKNHDNCDSLDCPLAAGPHRSCTNCQHRSGQICALTRAPLPEIGGCCHHNILLIHGPQAVTREMLMPLGLGARDTDLERVLIREDVLYQTGSQGELWVDPDDLALPNTYGLGTDHLPEEKFFWLTADNNEVN